MKRIGLSFLLLVMITSTGWSMSNKMRQAVVSKLDRVLRELCVSSNQSTSVATFLESRARFIEHRNELGLTTYEVIVRSSHPQAARALGVVPNTIEKDFFTALVTRDQLIALSLNDAVKSIEAPRIYKLMLDKSIVEMKVDKVHAGQVNSTVYKGKGIIIGIIDSGIDWSHLDFRSDTDPTKSRILYLWDQTITGTAPSGFTYGAEYTQAQINSELGSSPPGVVKDLISSNPLPITGNLVSGLTQGYSRVYARTFGKDSTKIIDSLEILWTGQPIITKTDATPTFTIPDNGSAGPFTFTVMDYLNHPMSVNTSITVEGNGLAVDGNASTLMPDTKSTGAGFTDFTVSIRDAAPNDADPVAVQSILLITVKHPVYGTYTKILATGSVN